VSAAHGLDSASGSRRFLDLRDDLVDSARSQDFGRLGLLIAAPVSYQRITGQAINPLLIF